MTPLSTWTQPQPIDVSAEKYRLEKIAQGLLARNDIRCVRVEPNPDWLRLLTDDGKKQLEEDLESLSAERIVRHFPWDAAGRLELKTAVLLRTLETTPPPGKDRNVCLAAVGPERRRDEQRIAIQLLDLIVVNQTHRWERTPWLWKDIAVPVDEFLGIGKVQSPATGQTETPEDERAAQSLRLLDEGRVEEALAEFGVSMSADLHHLLGGGRIKPPGCCAHPDATWTQLLIDTLRQSAPWLLPKAVLDEVERLRIWAAQKKGRTRSAPNLRLAIFPGQFHQRKASLMLTGDKEGANPHLVIETTASNARLADTAWQRPIAVDFLRRGVPFPAT